MKKTLFISLLALCTVLFAYKLYSYENKSGAPGTINYLEIQKNLEKGDAAKASTEDAESKETSLEEPKTKPRPATQSVGIGSRNRQILNIEVPFFTQAPYANWDYPWQEACEEASILNIVNLYQNKNFNLDSFNAELLRLIEWEKSYFGDYKHTNIAETAEMMTLQYNLKTEIYENPTLDNIQEILSKGHLIIAPFAGKLLGNPNFRNGGPNYHMLVIKGYDAGKMQIVTNDVGTRNGSNYVYDWITIQNALHDWNDSEITLGAKKIIEVFPSELLIL